jgi:hypothetical protein
MEVLTMEDWCDFSWHRPTDDVSWMIVGIHVYWWSGSGEIHLYILFLLPNVASLTFQLDSFLYRLIV